MKQIISRQYRENLNAARVKLAGLDTPSEGWLRSMRKALGMSGAQLGRRMGITRDAVSKFEKAELDGAITIKSMQNMALEAQSLSAERNDEHIKALARKLMEDQSSSLWDDE